MRRGAGRPSAWDCIAASYSDQAFAPHTHETFVIGVNVRGAHRFRCRGAEHGIPPGTLALVNPGEVHTGADLGDAGWEYRGMYPSLSALQRVWHELGATGEPEFARPSVVDPVLARLVADAVTSVVAGCEALEEESRIVEALTHLLDRHAATRARASASRGGDHPAVRVTREILETRYAEPLTLEELAQTAGLSRYYLLRLFRLQAGVTPHEYLSGVRVRAAERLLRAGASPAQAASDAGFSDQSHLHRHFRRILGVTPGVFRNARRRLSRATARGHHEPLDAWGWEAYRCDR